MKLKKQNHTHLSFSEVKQDAKRTHDADEHCCESHQLGRQVTPQFSTKAKNLAMHDFP